MVAPTTDRLERVSEHSAWRAGSPGEVSGRSPEPPGRRPPRRSRGGRRRAPDRRVPRRRRPAAVSAARCAPSGSAHDTIALFEGPRSSRARNALARPTSWSCTSCGSSEQREPQRRLGARPRRASRARRRTGWRRRPGRAPDRRRRPTGRRRSTSRRRAATARPSRGPRTPRRRCRAASTATCRCGRRRRSASRSVVGSQPVAWVTSTSTRASYARAAATHGRRVGHLAGAGLHEGVGDHPGVRADGVGEVAIPARAAPAGRRVPGTAGRPTRSRRRRTPPRRPQVRRPPPARRSTTPASRSRPARGVDAEQRGGVAAAPLDQRGVLRHVGRPLGVPLQVAPTAAVVTSAGQPERRHPRYPRPPANRSRTSSPTPPSSRHRIVPDEAPPRARFEELFVRDYPARRRVGGRG